MSLRKFLDAAYVLLIEQFQRPPGVHYYEAVDRIRDLSGMPPPEQSTDVPAQNQQAMQQLLTQLPGGRMPG